MSLFKSLGRRALFTLDAETAHGLSISALKAGMLPACNVKPDPRLAVRLAGLDFPNPVGLAAGYDKNGEVPDAILRLGFGFTEVGTLTPLPQSGNEKPRIFRLTSSQGVINRLGFNNHGHAAARKRLEARRDRPGIVGINIGANKASEDFVADYEQGIANFADLASYFTINISSPNTPGLRNLQAGEALKVLIDRVFEAREKTGHKPPVFLKLAPDLEDKDIAEISAVMANSPLSAVMISNTTLSRKGVEGEPNAREAGGLSGAPLFKRSTVMLARFRQALPQTMPLIGIGGISDGKTAFAKIEAGASLVQLYSGMVYEGPGIAKAILGELSTILDQEGAGSLEDICGRKSDEWAALPI